MTQNIIVYHSHILAHLMIYQVPCVAEDLPNILGKIPEIALFYWVMQIFSQISLKMCVMFISSVLKDIILSNALLSTQ